jgi:hypothetical protein
MNDKEIATPMDEPHKPAVGDLGSTAKGSGARFNAGKDRLDLIPAGIQACVYALKIPGARPPVESGSPLAKALVALEMVEFFMRYRDRRHLFSAISIIDPTLEQAAKVFEYGTKKYAAWNWIKGMAWSVPVGCICRHARAIIVDEEVEDPESKLPHEGHISCNLIMLAQFAFTYIEGDDLAPKEFL